MPLTPNVRFKIRGVHPINPTPDAREIPVLLPASVSYPAGTILGEQTGTNEVQSISVDATGGTFTITYGGATTTAINFGATAAQVQAALVALSSLADNAIQTITLGGGVTGGTFVLSFGGLRSAQLSYNATAAQVQTALENLATIGVGNVTVTGGSGGPYTVTFSGWLGGKLIEALEADTTFLQPAGTAITVAQTTLGGGGIENVLVTGNAGGPFTITFQGVKGDTNVAQVTCDSTLLTGNTHTATPSTTTAGVAGTARTMKKWSSTATDGSQTAVAILKYDAQTDSAGNITLGEVSTGGEQREFWPSVPAWVRGDFSTKDLVDATPTNIAQLGKIIQGSLAAGGILRIT